MAKEFFLHRIISIHQTDGAVHIEAEVDSWEGEVNVISLEWSASSLLDDIPSLYEFADKAEKGWLKHRKQKYIELKKKINK